MRAPAPARKILRTHWAWDIGAWTLTRELARQFRASVVGGRWSRLFLDLNRPAGDPTLIRREAGGMALPWNLDLSPREVRRRVHRYHTPYHVEVDRMILRRLDRGIRPFLLAVHTFTPVLGARRRRFDIGVLYADHPRLARRLGQHLRAGGLAVRYNEPYSGLEGMMYSVNRHGSEHGLPCLELEVNQALLDRRASVARLAIPIGRALKGSSLV